MDHATRRRFLTAAGVGGLTSLSGCGGDGLGALSGGGGPELEDGTVESGSLPPYASFLPAGDRLVFTAFDLAADDGRQFDAVPDDPTDPLRFNGAYGAVAAVVTGTAFLGIEPGFSAERFDLAERTHYLGVDGVAVAVMPVDLAGVRSDLADGVTVHHDHEDALVFTGPEGGVFGVTDDAFLFTRSSEAVAGFDPVERVRAIVDAHTGQTTPLSEADDEFRALLERGDTAGAVSGAYVRDGDLAGVVDGVSLPAHPAPFRWLAGGFGAATGGLFHLTTKNGDAPQPATATLRYPDGEAVDAGALTSTVGAAASDRSYVQDGTWVRAEGTYTWDELRDFEREGQGIGVQ